MTKDIEVPFDFCKECERLLIDERRLFVDSKVYHTIRTCVNAELCSYVFGLHAVECYLESCRHNVKGKCCGSGVELEFGCDAYQQDRAVIAKVKGGKEDGTDPCY